MLYEFLIETSKCNQIKKIEAKFDNLLSQFI